MHGERRAGRAVPPPPGLYGGPGPASSSPSSRGGGGGGRGRGRVAGGGRAGGRARGPGRDGGGRAPGRGPPPAGRGALPGGAFGPQSRTFGRGAAAVCYEPDGKEVGVFRVGPAPGQRFGPAFLQGLSVLVAHLRHLAGGGDPACAPAAAPGLDSGLAVEDATEGSSGGAYLDSPFEAEPVSGGAEEGDDVCDTADSAAAAAAEDEGELGLLEHLLSTMGLPSGGGSTATAGESAAEDAAPAAPARHQWWPASPEAAAAAAAGRRASVLPAPPPPPPPPPPRLLPCGRVGLSLRLERAGVTDIEAAALADWAEAAAGACAVTKLWLFGSRLTDAGAAHVARVVRAAGAGLVELHLSHNMLTAAGAAAVLAAVPAARPPPRRPLWLRLEWNRVSLAALAAELQRLHDGAGLVADVPEAVRAADAPPAAALPPYLAAAAAAAAAARRRAPPPPPPRLGAPNNKLANLVQACHVRLPWLSCQFLVPSEAPLLREARALYGAPPPPPPPHAPQALVPPPEPAPRGDGPLLVFLDTSALLLLLDAGGGSPLALSRLDALAGRGLFGRALPPGEQVFLVVPDTVVRQLDGLKAAGGAAAVASRRFFGWALDALGPAGHDVLTVLGSHEGEGLLVDADAHSAGSQGIGAKGQRADARIVEVALFFQREILGGAGAGTAGDAAAMPVLLLTADNGQLALAKAHGLPAARAADAAAAAAALAPSAPLTAGALRRTLSPAARAGLGSPAGARSLQAEFDGAVAVLSALVRALEAAPDGGAAVCAAAALPLGALRARVRGWEAAVRRAALEPSRVLEWSASGSGGGG